MEYNRFEVSFTYPELVAILALKIPVFPAIYT